MGAEEPSHSGLRNLRAHVAASFATLRRSSNTHSPPSHILCDTQVMSPMEKSRYRTQKLPPHADATGYWQQLESGAEATDYRIDYVIGSGNHASGYLLDVAGHLFQSPIAYYKSRQAYDLAPGYEGLSHPDFTRPISEACLFCHAGAALKIPGTSNQYRSPPFAAESITCERCHGSAEKHLTDPRAGTIINPAKLAPAACDSICEQCHLLGVGRVLNPGKKQPKRAAPGRHRSRLWRQPRS
jgi:Cytochrome c554 and c-prime